METNDIRLEQSQTAPPDDTESVTVDLREDVRAPIPRRTTWSDRFRWVFRQDLCFGGLSGALVFFCLSLTPSLLPRTGLLQGAISGITAVIGYGLGSALSALIRKVIPREPDARTKRIAWWTLLSATIVLVPTFLWLGRNWQQRLRDLMGIETQAAWRAGQIMFIALFVASLILIVSRVIRGMTRVIIRLLDRWVPRPISVSVGVLVSTVVAIGLVQGFVLKPAVGALNNTFSVVNDGTSEGIVQPTQPERSGSPESVIPWETLGVKGRDFIGEGPTVDEISQFTRRQASQPIRIYAGLKSADNVDERVALIMTELDRTGAWSRNVLTVFTTTGTGWVDPRASAPLEYMHNGDTALVALQYSYLPSWISFLVDQEKAVDAAQALIGAVQERWSQLPPDSRPQLLLFGESLGSFGTESAFDDIDDMLASVDGALLVGPVFQNDIHSDLTAGRDDGSPLWLPVSDNGINVRFAVEPDDLADPTVAWERPRIVYLQNSSDPITYWEPDLIWDRPDWLSRPRGPDVSTRMFWTPVITFWQTAADMAFSTGVPAGHGHVYGANPVDAWVAISTPQDWSDTDTQRLRDIIGHK